MRIYLCVTDSQDFAYLDPDLKHTGTEKLAKYISMFSLKLKFKQKYKVIYKKNSRVHFCNVHTFFNCLMIAGFSVKKKKWVDPDPCYFLDPNSVKLIRIRTNPDPQH